MSNTVKLYSLVQVDEGEANTNNNLYTTERIFDNNNQAEVEVVKVGGKEYHVITRRIGTENKEARKSAIVAALRTLLEHGGLTWE